jgi:DNA-binding XRE family transcriptional regulator
VREGLRIAGWCLAAAGVIAAAVVVVIGTAFATSEAALAVWAEWAAIAALPFSAIGMVLLVAERISRTGEVGRGKPGGVHEVRGPQAAGVAGPATIREALAFGKALHDIRTDLGLSVAELAVLAGLAEDDIWRIEEGGTEPTIPLLRRLAAALNAEVRLTAGDDPGSVRFESRVA